MIRTITIALLMLIGMQATLYAQTKEIKVNGNLKDNAGQPMIGVTITIKGTSKGTITDINGNYTIQAPLGSTLVFALIGMKTKEAVVTLTGLNPVGTHTIIPYNTDTEASKVQSQRDKEKAFREKEYKDRMEKYNLYLSGTSIDDKYSLVSQPIDTTTEKQIRKLLRNYNDNNPKIRLGKIEVSSNTSIYWAGRLPQLQTSFAQGRPDGSNWQYRGPETGEIFSWGPKLSNLEYDGQSTDYDLNGNLVYRGNGNGKQAAPYQSDKLFRQGFSTNNAICIYQTVGKLYSNLSYANTNSKGILPGMDNTSHSFNAKMKGYNFDGWINYSQQTSHWQDAALQARTLYSALITPPSFDNRNNLSVREAARKANAIYTSSGSLRSFAPSLTDNPFYLLQTTSNPYSGKNLAGQISYNYHINNNLNGVIYGGGEWFKNNRSLEYGNQTAQLAPGTYLKRSEEFSSHLEGGHLEYRYSRYQNYELLIKLPFFISQSHHNIRSSNSYTQAIDDYQPSLSRNYWSTSPTFTFNHNKLGLYLQAGGQHYQSSTAKHSYLSSFVGIGIKPLNILDELLNSNAQGLMEMKFTFNYNRPVKEYDLKYSYGSGNSLRYNVAGFPSNINNQELGVSTNVKPEIANHLNGGIHISVLNNRISTNFELYHNRTSDAIYPVFDNGHQLLTNVGNITVKGWEESLTFHFGNYRKVSWDAIMSASRSVSKVDKLYVQTPVVIAGFSDVSTALVQGEPVGVIVGSRYQRNTNGQRVIGPDGFPLVDAQKQVVANPNPKMTLGLSNTFGLEGFSLSFTVQAQIGGKIWNGTRATLDYYGVSAQTGQQRYVTDYIFDGVTQSGSINNVAVTFTPKDQSVETNRWVRYGVAGVTEDYIEDASNVVLKELKLSYNFKDQLIRHLGLYSLTTAVVANNLVTLTGYKGVAPTGSLWGHSNGNSLDYFNMPIVRSLGFNLKLSF